MCDFIKYIFLNCDKGAYVKKRNSIIYNYFIIVLESFIRFAFRIIYVIR